MHLPVRVHWLEDGEDEDSSTYSRVLYAYSHPRTNEVLYIGKADYCTVQERQRGAHKEAVFLAIQTTEQIDRVILRVGVLYLEASRKFSTALLSDIESLLIYRVQPRYNKQATKSRISRPGLAVNCTGDWQYRDSHFVDRQ